MKPRQLLISVCPAAWEWMPTLGIALLGVLGLAAGIAGAPFRLIHAMLGLLAALPLLWLSVAHTSDAHLRRRLNAGRELSGVVTLLALTLTLLSGTGRFLVSPVPVWSVSLHRWGAVTTLLTAVLHLAISPHHRVVFSRGGSGSSSPPQKPPKLSGDVAATRGELRKLAGRGLPGVHPGMSLQETLAILIDYLLDNDLVRRGGEASLRAGMG